MSIVFDTLSDIVLTIADMLFARKENKRASEKEGCRGCGQ